MALEYFIFGMIAIAILVFVVLGFYENKIKSECKQPSVDPKKLYLRELKKISKSADSGKKVLERIDFLAKKIFSERYSIRGKFDYGELEKNFKKKSMRLEEEFSKKMLFALYSKENISKKQIFSLVKFLEKIIG